MSIIPSPLPGAISPILISLPLSVNHFESCILPVVRQQLIPTKERLVKHLYSLLLLLASRFSLRVLLVIRQSTTQSPRLSSKMRFQAVAAALSLAVVGQVVAEDATPVTDNPAGVAYKATLPKERFFKDAALDGNVKGSISAVAAADGNGVKFSVKFENLPKEGGPFSRCPNQHCLEACY